MALVMVIGGIGSTMIVVLAFVPFADACSETPLLPFTTAVVAEKLANLASGLFGTQVRAGIAGFPEDDVTGTGLVAEAEEALSFARIAQITVASRSLLS